MRRLLPLLIAAMTAGAHGAQTGALDYPSIWECDTSKFNWYCDDEPARENQRSAPRPAAVEPSSSAPKRLDIRDIKTAEQLRAELKRREDVAVMDPSDKNLKDYLQLWHMSMEKGSVFADNWRRVVWQNPELDYAQRRPTNNAAIRTYDQARGANQEQHLRSLAKEHGLIFFFSSDCPYCHAMAPVLQLLQAKFGIEVLPVSIDGKGLPGFPAPRDGRAQAAAWGVERVPALFIASKQTADHAPIGFGAMALTEIIERIFVLTGTKPGENF